MKGEWKVYSQYIYPDGKFYRVGRQLDLSEPLHSGNVEYANGVYNESEKEKAQHAANVLNEKGED